MAKCPNGHDSTSADYCGACGYSINGAAASDSVRAVGKHHAPRLGAAPTEYCPRCGAVSSRQGRGTCGFRFRARRPFAPLAEPEPEPELSYSPSRTEPS